MATFADLMSLLLTFFVLLLSFSTISDDKFNQALMSLQGGFRPFPMSAGFITLIPKPPKHQKDEAAQTARRIRRRLQVRGLEQKVKIEYDALGGIKINLPSSLLFDQTEATLKPGALPVIQDIAEILGELPQSFFEVQGHTDARPLSNTLRFRDNYDLSYQRAHSVTEQLVIAGGSDVDQFEIHAIGSGQPVATNATPEGRSANRRVEIYVRGLLDKNKLNRLLQGLDTGDNAERTTDLPITPRELDDLR
jgi:chemotaxis protein MotB